MKSKRWNLGFFTSRFVTPGKSTVWFCCFSWVEGYIHIISNVWNRFPLSHLYSCVNCTVVYQFHSFTAKGADLAGSSCVHQCLKRTTHFQKVVGKGLPFFFGHWDANWSCCSQLNQQVLIVGSVARTDQHHTHNSAGRREKTRFYRACTRQLRTQFARLGLKINYIPEIDQRPKSYENLKWNRPLFLLWPCMRKTKLRNKRADRIPAPNKSLLGMSWGYRKNQPEFRKHARTSSGLSEYPPFGEHTQTLEPNPSSYPHDKTKNHTARYIQDMIGLPPMSKVASMKEKTETHFEN